MGWSDAAKAAIQRAHQAMPEDVLLEERMKLIDAAYPFGERSCFPYKAWLKERRAYLGRYGYRGRGEKAHMSPLERMMAKAEPSHD